MNSMFPKQLPEFITNRLLFQVEDLIHSNKSKTHLVMGKSPESDSIIMQSNDYLSIANHPEIKQVHTDAINKCDASVVMSAIFLQSEKSKPNFEKQLADYTGMSSCLLSQSGWAANIGLLQTICAPQPLSTLTSLPICHFGKERVSQMRPSIPLCITTSIT